MDNLLLAGVLILMLAAALLTVLTDRLFTAVIYAGVLSCFAAFCYLLLGAPDVALAEAIIGSALSTVIFLVTLKKYKLFTVYVRDGRGGKDKLSQALSLLARALQERDIEPHTIHTTEPVQSLLKRPECDLVLERQGGHVIIHSEEQSQYAAVLREHIKRAGLSNEILLSDSLQDRKASYREGDEA